MKRKQPTNETITPEETVQDYLDLILKPDSVPTESKVSQLKEGTDSSDTSVPSDMVDTASRRADPSISFHKRHGDKPASKSFAEPVKPLTLNMSSPLLKSEKLHKSKDYSKTPITKTSVAETPVAKTPVAFAKNIPSVPVLADTIAKPVDIVETRKINEEVNELSYRVDQQDNSIEDVITTIDNEHVVADDTTVTSDKIETTSWLKNGRPSWAQTRFECLLFSVGGLSLAVPLVELGSIYSLEDGLTPIFGQAGWFMGLFSVKDSTIKTVNTAKVVMPERYNEKMKENYSYVITINRVDWGLAVDSVSTSITLEPENIRWRGERSKRPWLAGTVIDQMCALLDVSQLALMFTEQDRH